MVTLECSWTWAEWAYGPSPGSSIVGAPSLSLPHWVTHPRWGLQGLRFSNPPWAPHATSSEYILLQRGWIVHRKPTSTNGLCLLAIVPPSWPCLNTLVAHDVWLGFFLSTLSPAASFMALKDERQHTMVERMWLYKQGRLNFKSRLRYVSVVSS